jgi:outer membrane protein OmpA-like peptidoglycan-associated protein
VDTPKPPKPPVVTTVKPTKPPKPPKPPRIDPPKKEVVVKPKPEKPKVFSSEIKITEIKENETLEMSHINFGKGTYHLLPTSIPELKDLVKFMKDNNTVRIRLEGHTESGGDPTKNILLSENRVKEVKKYLVENGIETGRIEWVGHGGGKPLYVGDDEEQKKLNRRVEVVVISK